MHIAPQASPTSSATFDVGRCGAIFKDSVVLLLLAASVMKLWLLLGGHPLPQEIDPVFGMPFRSLLAIALVLEIVAFMLLVFRGRSFRAWIFVATLATLIALYRATLWCLDYRLPCSCLGPLPAWMGLSPQAGDKLAIGILIYLVAGSYAALLLGRRGR